MIQGLRTNPKDPESHILVFDIEALIGMALFMNINNCVFALLVCMFSVIVGTLSWYCLLPLKYLYLSV